MVIIVSEIINGIEYKEITVRGRTKLVSKYGDLINPRKRNQKATLHMNKDGYPCCGGGIPIHLYVAYGWVDGNFEGAEVNHKDYDRTNYIWTIWNGLHIKKILIILLSIQTTIQNQKMVNKMVGLYLQNNKQQK